MKRYTVFIICAMCMAFAIGWSSPDPSEIVYPVNMSTADGRLFVSDRYSGVHVFDVAEPDSPSHSYSIALRGNEGNAVVGDVLFANDDRSLKAFHLGKESYVEIASFERQQEEVHWLEGPRVERSSGFGCDCSDDSMSPNSAPSSSTGSSYATFAVVDDYLYYLDYGKLVTLDVSDPLKPKEIGRTRIGWDVETLYPTEHYLFMGGSRGMYIYERSNPAAPTEIGNVQHVRACDPVVVEGHTAFVTLRGQGNCGGARDVLLSIDIKEPANPGVICETSIATPHGLAVDGTLLYVSKGDNGFVLYDVSSPDKPTAVATWGDSTKDFIWIEDVLYSMTFDEVNIYDVADPAAPKLVSTLE